MNISNPLYLFKNKYFTLFLELPGIISPDYCWVIIYSGYMHTNESLFRLLVEVITEFKSDKHIVGY